MYTIINDDFMLQSEAQLHVSDLSIQRGYGIFDFFKVLDSKPIFLDDHLDRFYGSAGTMNLPVKYQRPELKEMLYELIRKNEMADAGIRINLTGGYAVDSYTVSKPNLVVTQSSISFSQENFEKGISLMTDDHQRQLPGVKTIDYLHAIYLQPQIKLANANDVLYFSQSKIRECPRANFFLVKENGDVVTPAKEILKGITRKKILEFNDMPIREEDVSIYELADAKESFITSTTKNVLPVLSIDGKPVGNGKPGETTRKINELLKNLWTVPAKQVHQLS